MAFRVVRLRREARRNAKLEEIFMVMCNDMVGGEKENIELIFSGKRQEPEWNHSFGSDFGDISYVRGRR